MNVDLVAVKHDLDTSSPAGRLVYSVLSCVAEFERELLRERVRSGLAQARRNGKRLGRPPLRRFGENEMAQIRVLRKKGASVRGLAIRFGVVAKLVASEKQNILGA